MHARIEYSAVLFLRVKKTSSKDLLQQYVDLKSEMSGGFDIVGGEIISAKR